MLVFEAFCELVERRCFLSLSLDNMFCLDHLRSNLSCHNASPFEQEESLSSLTFMTPITLSRALYFGLRTAGWDTAGYARTTTISTPFFWRAILRT